MSKEPRPLPQPGDPQYRDPGKPRPSSPPPPPKKASGRVTRCTTHSHACPCREYRMAKMEAALREIEVIAKYGRQWNEQMAVVYNKCREALATGEGE